MIIPWKGVVCIPGSTAFVPPVSGYIMASVVVRDILEN